MKFFVFLALFGFCFHLTADEVSPKSVEGSIEGDEVIAADDEYEVFYSAADTTIYMKDDKNYKLDEETGEFIPSGMIVLGEASLKEQCESGTSFDPSTAKYDEGKAEHYYTIVNDTDSEVLISRATADKSRVFCSTPYHRLKSRSCVKWYENDRLHSLAKISVPNGVLCGEESGVPCELGNYRITLNQGFKIILQEDYRLHSFAGIDRSDDCDIL